ncbi:MAG TPA: YqgE/AlgH family protein [Stellaceae bacterium]|nr:YqgE/AlgH family protein [Stellaceae bacterium]
MRNLGIKRLVLAAMLLLLSAALSGASAPQRDAAEGSGSLAGQLLVAAPEMSDPRFAQTVILVVWHDARGALGIIINRPVGEHALASLMEAVGAPDASVKGSVPLFLGGPVETQKGFVIHSTDYHRPETIAIDRHVAMTSSPELLRDIGHGKGPQKALVAFGYAGWAPGQLEAEMARQQWFTEPEDPKLLFDEARDNVWDEAMSRRSREL